MKFRLIRFNLNFLVTAFLGVMWLAGCSSPGERKGKKEMTVLRLHLETPSDKVPYTSSVSVLRSAPIRMAIHNQPFLDERSVKEAAVVDLGHTFGIQLQFDDRGRFYLETITQASRGQRIAFFSEFGEIRWLAAVKITHVVTDGILTFTPDSSREEAERIVRGLNNFKRRKSKTEHFPEK